MRQIHFFVMMIMLVMNMDQSRESFSAAIMPRAQQIDFDDAHVAQSSCPTCTTRDPASTQAPAGRRE